MDQARPKAVHLSLAGRPHPTAARLRDDSDDETDHQESGAVDSDSVEDDFDAPRVAQWVDDEQLDLDEQTDDSSTDHEQSEDDRNAGSSQRLRSLEDDLSTMPLGTLRNAQRSLAQAHSLSDAESDSVDGDVSTLEDDGYFPTDNKGREKSSKQKKDLAKRANKHAPTEVSSKRPVSRRRVVIDDMLPKPRDPRFMCSAGRYDTPKFRQRYDFLSGLRNDELSVLREHLKRARKLVASSPSHLRAEREEEVIRLERAMKRAESTVNMDNRERVELKALQSAKQTEIEKRKQGKAGWWMKRSEKKELLVKARLDAIAAVGGRQAVKKAVEKKQKKTSQKEKKMRPFPRSQGTELSNGKRRRPVGSLDPGAKRRKVV